MSEVLQEDVELFPLLLSIIALGASLAFSSWVVFTTSRSGSGKKQKVLNDNDEGIVADEYDEDKEATETDTATSASKTDERSEVLLSWRGVSCSYPVKKRSQGKVPAQLVTTLHDSYGELLAGQSTAIIGVSGSGKTTLLDILSGRKAVGKITGEVSINGTAALIDGSLDRIGASLRQAVAYVPQDEAFFPMQTPEEAVEFVTKLRHGPHGSRRSDIRAALLEVGLCDPELYSRPIGGALVGGLAVPGLSGGEKKRLALACALVLKTKLIMLDEITSGLDSENALLTMERVRQVCRQRKVAAVIVIHQPNGFVFETFDRLILLSNGRTIFSDHVSKLGVFYEHHFGCVMPTSKHELPVDLLERSKHTLTPFTARVNADTNCHPYICSHAIFERTSDSEVSGLWKLFVVLQRNLVNHYVRNYTNVAARLACYAACALLCGAIFWGVGTNRNPTIVGALTFIFDVCLFNTILLCSAVCP